MDLKRLLKNKLAYGIAVFAVSLFFFGCQIASAATMQINSGSATLSPGDTATLYVVLNSEGVAINNAEATIKFPTNLFSVVSINKANSIFSLWVEDPSFSNSSGVINFDGGVPTPGFNGTQGPVIAIVVRAKAVGQANFSFTNAAVRANDGLGTDVLSNKQGKTLNVVEVAQPADVVAPTPTVTTSNLALQISSLTHPNQDQWYRDNNPIFQWTVPDGSDTVKTTVDNNTSGTPHVSYSPAISKKAVKDLADGVWYFKVRAHKGDVWGPISTYIVRVDNTSPEKGNVVFSYNDNSKILNISSDIQDVTSGIDHYEIYINDVLIKTVPAIEFVNGNYSLAFNASGDSTVKLVAIDRAGNSLETLGSFSASSTATLSLQSIPSSVSVDEQLLIRGLSQNPNTDVTVNVKNDNNEPIVLQTKSNSDSSFFVLTPKLKSGDYNIWAETGSGDNKVSSQHIFTKTTSQMLVTIGSFTITMFNFVMVILLVALILIVGAYILGRRNSRYSRSLNIRKALLKGDDSKILIMLKKRLEKHLEIIQHTRHNRVLTKEEKEIKEAIEGDLDEVDKAMSGQK